jgi:hypothetical protein
MGDVLVYVIDLTRVVSSPAHAFPRGRSIIAAEEERRGEERRGEERIAQLQASAAFAVVVYVTESGRMVVVSARTARRLAVVQFNGERVEKLLIIETWGLSYRRQM